MYKYLYLVQNTCRSIILDVGSNLKSVKINNKK
jgi:hypothetical protein